MTTATPLAEIRPMQSAALTEVAITENGHTICVFRWGTETPNPTPAGALRRRTPGQTPPPLLFLVPYPDQQNMPPTPDPAQAPHWMVQRTPTGRGLKRHIQRRAAANDRGVTTVPPEQFPVTLDGDGTPLRLDLPGLSLPWGTVVGLLDAFTETIEGPWLPLTLRQFSSIAADYVRSTSGGGL